MPMDTPDTEVSACRIFFGTRAGSLSAKILALAAFTSSRHDFAAVARAHLRDFRLLTPNML